MLIDIVTLFPEMFDGPFVFSIIKRAQEKGLIKINIHNLRKWTLNKHKTVDGRPYGGGPGMILRVDIIDRAVSDLKSESKGDNPVVLLLDAGGETYNQNTAKKFSKLNHLIILCGHYEGVDFRVHKHIADKVISVGDYVLSGGEIPAMTIVDSIVRLIPNVIDPESLKEESFSKIVGKKEYPQFTRPEKYNGWKVPEILLSGHHGNISKWRKCN